MVNPPFIYHFDQDLRKLERVEAVRQRIQERQKKLQAINGSHTGICQIANEVLSKPNIQEANQFDLTQKIELIKQRIESRQDKLSQIECEHVKVLRIADNAFMQAEKEIQNAQSIEQEQKEMSQHMLIVRHDLTVAHGKAAFFKQRQIDISKNIELMQKIIREAFHNVIFPRLDKVFLDIAQVKFNHEKFDKGFEELDEQSQEIQIDQAKLGIKANALNQSGSSCDTMDWIMNAQVLQNPIVKEKVQEVIDAHPVFQLAAAIAIDPSGEKFNEAWEQIKNSTQSISSYLWTNLTFIGSKTVSWIAWTALKVNQLEQKIVSTLAQWGWSYVASQVSPITWIAIGVFASYFATSLIANYPLLSLAVFGYLFLVYMNYHYIKPMIWPTSE
jgi:hypothetical protein